MPPSCSITRPRPLTLMPPGSRRRRRRYQGAGRRDQRMPGRGLRGIVQVAPAPGAPSCQRRCHSAHGPAANVCPSAADLDQRRSRFPCPLWRAVSSASAARPARGTRYVSGIPSSTGGYGDGDDPALELVGAGTHNQTLRFDCDLTCATGMCRRLRIEATNAAAGDQRQRALPLSPIRSVLRSCSAWNSMEASGSSGRPRPLALIASVALARISDRTCHRAGVPGCARDLDPARGARSGWRSPSLGHWIDPGVKTFA